VNHTNSRLVTACATPRALNLRVVSRECWRFEVLARDTDSPLKMRKRRERYRIVLCSTVQYSTVQSRITEYSLSASARGLDLAIFTIFEPCALPCAMPCCRTVYRAVCRHNYCKLVKSDDCLPYAVLCQPKVASLTVKRPHLSVSFGRVPCCSWSGVQQRTA